MCSGWCRPSMHQKPSWAGQPLRLWDLNTAEILRATASANNEGVDFSQISAHVDYKRGKIASIIARDSLFHEHRGILDDEDDGPYIEIGPDDPTTSRSI
eukprot:IDg2117t1